ncbi:hypothetical protein D3C85_1033900 [compost metagenome]
MADGDVLLLQPGDVVAIAPGLARHRFTAIALQHFAQQLGIAPAIHQDVVVGVDQVVVMLGGAHQHQAQQGRLVQVQALGTFFVGQGLQGRVQRVTSAPVEHRERHLDLAIHHLDRVFEIALPEETAAQDVMGIDHRLPGLTESLRIETVDVQAHLVDVIAIALFQQRVEQHALLHR